MQRVSITQSPRSIFFLKKGNRLHIFYHIYHFSVLTPPKMKNKTNLFAIRFCFIRYPRFLVISIIRYYGTSSWRAGSYLKAGIPYSIDLKRINGGMICLTQGRFPLPCDPSHSLYLTGGRNMLRPELGNLLRGFPLRRDPEQGTS